MCKKDVQKDFIIRIVAIKNNMYKKEDILQ